MLPKFTPQCHLLFVPNDVDSETGFYSWSYVTIALSTLTLNGAFNGLFLKFMHSRGYQYMESYHYLLRHAKKLNDAANHIYSNVLNLSGLMLWIEIISVVCSAGGQELAIRHEWLLVNS